MTACSRTKTNRILLYCIDLKQKDRYFSRKAGFLSNQQRTVIRGLQQWQAMVKSPPSKGRRTFLKRGKRSWEGYNKQKVHGFFSLAEFLPGKNWSLSSSCWVPLPGDFSSGPVGRTPQSHCCRRCGGRRVRGSVGLHSIAGWGTNTPDALQHSQKKKKKKVITIKLKKANKKKLTSSPLVSQFYLIMDILINFYSCKTDHAIHLLKIL